MDFNDFPIGGDGEEEPISTAGYNFAELPLVAGDITADDLVFEFNQGAASNVTGTPGANITLTGADLVFVQSGSVGASVAGWTPIVDGSSQYFSPTVPWMNQFSRNAAGFSILQHLRNFNATLSGPKYLAFLMSASNVTAIQQSVDSGFLLISNKSKEFCGSVATGYSSALSDLLPTSGEVYILNSVDYANNLAFSGVSVGATQPSSLSDFALFCITETTQAMPPAISGFYAGPRSCIIGSYNSNALGMEVKSLTCRLGPSVTAS